MVSEIGFKVVVENEFRAIRVAGCGHVVYLGVEHQAELRRTHRSFWCTICGNTNVYKGESDIESLTRQLTSKQDMLDTARQQRDDELVKRRTVERRLTAQRGATKRIKNRVGNGVCPCCTRSFANLRGHMATKHPGYSKSPA